MMRQRTLIFSLLFCLATPLWLGACADVDDDQGPINIDEIPVTRQGSIVARRGYFNEKRVEYYDFGNFVPADAAWFPAFEDKFPGMRVNELFVFDDGSGKLSLDGAQHPIVDYLPKQARYSDFLEIVLVKPDGGYAANDIKSRGTLLRAGYALEYTGKVVNCPVAGVDSELGGTTQQPIATYKKVTLWYRGFATHCWLMEGGEALISGGGKPFNFTTTPISSERDELLVSAGEQFDLRADVFGGEDRRAGIPVPDNAIFRYSPAEETYSPLAQIFDVTVPSDYQVGQLASYADLYPVPDFDDPRIEKRDPQAFCNCPIVWIEQ
ncbi:MAG: hypothetical protein KC503_13735 [Myxococcales bacterium]|nr:hypothetical protein [Myxococcales bacterium]